MSGGESPPAGLDYSLWHHALVNCARIPYLFSCRKAHFQSSGPRAASAGSTRDSPSPSLRRVAQADSPRENPRFNALRPHISLDVCSGSSSHVLLRVVLSNGPQAPAARSLADLCMSPIPSAQAPLVRFGDTAANGGVLLLLVRRTPSKRTARSLRAPSKPPGRATYAPERFPTGCRRRPPARPLELRAHCAARVARPTGPDQAAILWALPAPPAQASQAPWVPLGVQTALSTAAGASLRLLLTPLDTLKTTSQVQGSKAAEVLLQRVREGGVRQLFNGALANFAAGWVGSYPWFFTYNTLDATLPPAAGLEGLARKCARRLPARPLAACEAMRSVCVGLGSRHPLPR